MGCQSSRHKENESRISLVGNESIHDTENQEESRVAYTLTFIIEADENFQEQLEAFIKRLLEEYPAFGSLLERIQLRHLEDFHDKFVLTLEYTATSMEMEMTILQMVESIQKQNGLYLMEFRP